MFHQGFKHSKTMRRHAFISFLMFETPMKHSHSFLKLLFQQKKISLNYHLNKFSQFNYYI